MKIRPLLIPALKALVWLAAVAAFLLGFAGMLASRHIDEMLRNNLLEIKADLSRPGIYAGRFRGVRKYVHGFEVYLRTPAEIGTPEEALQLLKPLKGRWVAFDDEGRVILHRSLRVSRRTTQVAYDAAPHYRMFSVGDLGESYPTETWPIRLVVEEGAPRLKEFDYTITARHPWCFLTAEAGDGILRFGAWLAGLSALPPLLWFLSSLVMCRARRSAAAG